VAAPNKKYYLFSVDLEDVRDMIDNGIQYKEAVVSNTQKYLAWLSKHKFKATFFVVGRTAQAFPSLIKEIADSGHEIALHSHNHIHLTKLTPEQFKADIAANINAIQKAGVATVKGFRAPTFSLVEQSKWAYKILRNAGIEYSSSVIPNTNPLFGWQNFGGEQMVDGVYEIPMNVGNKPFSVPFGGGVYFRVLPVQLSLQLFKNAAKKQQPVLGYFHPYDVDTEQERFMHPHLNNNKLLNKLMYINRSKVFNRLDRVIDLGFEVVRYDDYYRMQTE
jgi:polysaccharide deacetylase family protein (PEP-CTERM system associated)